MKRIAVIGGTGMKELVSGANFGKNGSESGDSGISISTADKLEIETEYGVVPAEVLLLNCRGEERRIFIVHRHHGNGKTTPPHLINYHANVKAAASCNPDVSDFFLTGYNNLNESRDYFEESEDYDLQFIKSIT